MDDVGTKTAAGEAGERDPKRWLILIVLCLSTLVLVIDNMVLTVAVPPIAEDLNASASDLQWILDSYMLVFAGLLLTTGSLSDRFGRRKVMLIGLLLFGVASLIATIAESPEQLIGARILMGVGGALIMPSTLSIVITVFDDEERPKAIAAWSSVTMVGLVGGPLFGGVLLDHFWWGSIFLINVPIAAVAFLAAIVLMKESKGPWRKADPVGMVLSMVGMVSLVWTITEWPKEGFGDPKVYVAAILSVLCLVGFGIWETRVDEPMVPLALFRNRVFTGASFSIVLLTFANGGLMLVLSQYLQFVLEYTPTKTGWAFAPLALASLVFNALSAVLGPKIGNRFMAALGLAVIASGFFTLTTLEPGDGFGIVTVAMVLMGAGGGLAMPAAQAAMMGAVPHEHAGVGSAMNDTVQQAGAALGVAVLGSILSSTYGSKMPDDAPGKSDESIVEAFAEAARTGNEALVRTARDAFTEAMSSAFVVGAIGVLVAAALSLVLMRTRGDDAQPTAAVPGAAQPGDGESAESPADVKTGR
ncbi:MULTISPECIES: MFS transporter [Streptomyces]|uniref:DHA2 family efflux MFS transporter permease subunit n=1 Tax=Streptomyces typhae TaxID=2681492 RepID=A0A6L6WY80_9ACTN|nr:MULTISPECIES: MFS transporter [Streptomyces]MVO86472.1 DHA2 family efflux MFS transporter permease subunit [Streptomyces typhae]